MAPSYVGALSLLANKSILAELQRLLSGEVLLLLPDLQSSFEAALIASGLVKTLNPNELSPLPG